MAGFLNRGSKEGFFEFGTFGKRSSATFDIDESMLCFPSRESFCHSVVMEKFRFGLIHQLSNFTKKNWLLAAYSG